MEKITHPTLILNGLMIRHTLKDDVNHQITSELKEAFLEQTKNHTYDVFYLVQIYSETFESDGTLTTFIGTEINESHDTFQTLHIESDSYMVYKHIGLESQIDESYKKAYGQLESDPQANFDLERHNIVSKSIEILIPLSNQTILTSND